MTPSVTYGTEASLAGRQPSGRRPAESPSPVQARIHHFGQIVRSVDAHLSGSLWEARSEVVTDPVQKAKLVLVSLPGDTTSPFIELVEPLGEDSPVWNALVKGGGWHHVCFEVATREEGDRLIAESRLLPVTDWVPAILFGGRSVRFVYSRNRELLELVTEELHG